jgi:hypothetical protein
MTPWNKGKIKPFSDETIQKMRDSHIGQQTWKGKHHSDKTKIKISIALTGRKGIKKSSRFNFDEIINRYHKNKDMGKTAQDFSMSRSYLQRILKQNNIILYKMPCRLPKWDKYKNKIIEMYNNGLSGTEISKCLPINISYPVIYNCLKQNGIQIKERGFQTGKANPSYIDGSTGHCGYKMILCPNHPRSRQGYVEEHVLVMEKKLGRPLKKGETVHHINRNKLDNRPENLMLFKNRREHTQYHWDNEGLAFVRTKYKEPEQLREAI